MADTGSEMAESTTKDTTDLARYLLERHFLWRGGRDQEDERQRQANQEEGSVSIDVHCPTDGFDERAHEVLEAMERAHVRAGATVDESRSTLVLSIPASDVERAQRALERLNASEKSGFTLADVTDLQPVEAVRDRRALGTDVFDTTLLPKAQPVAEPVKYTTITFANHPTDPARDRAHAEAYTRGMREMGFDANARPIPTAERDENDRYVAGTESVVAVRVGYPVRDRDDFALASLVVLHEVGALEGLGQEDPYLRDAAIFERDRERLMASSARRRAEGGIDLVGATVAAVAADMAVRDHGVPTLRETLADTQPIAATTERKGHIEPARDLTGGAKAMTVEEYDRLPVRERAKIDACDIPDGAFGRQGIRETAAQAVVAAAVLNVDREPARTHPAIGERVN